jgi:hypothetical protein
MTDFNDGVVAWADQSISDLPNIGKGGYGVWGNGGNGRSGVVGGTGVLGRGGKSEGAGSGPGIIGIDGNVNEPPENHTKDIGVYGRGSTGVVGVADQGDGRFVSPDSIHRADVGVFGVGDTGVRGNGSTEGVIGSSENVGVLGVCTSRGFGVWGYCDGPNIGVNGYSAQGDGVSGRSDGAGRGVYGESKDGVGVMGYAPQSGLAGFFQGRVTVVGTFVVWGSKHCAVPHPDGVHRLLYCMESPENWFEDFGEAQLVDGRATVQIDPEFASIVETDKYHVFLTPYGDSNGLYVSRRDSTEFQVSEHQGGKSNLSFSYRIAAKRKDVGSARLPKISMPDFPKVRLPESAALPRKLQATPDAK